MTPWLRGAQAGLLGAVLAIGCHPSDHPAAIETGDACDRAQAQLVELGCDVLQGYLLGRPSRRRDLSAAK